MREKEMLRAALCLALVVLFRPSLAAAEAQKPVSAKTDIRFGYMAGAFSEVAVRDVQVALELWSNDLQDRLGRTDAEVTVEILEDLANVEAALEAGRLDILIFGPIDFFKMNHREEVEPVMLPLTAGKVTQKYLLVVKRNRYGQVQDLKGKTLLVQAGGQGQMPLVWLETVLDDESLPDCSSLFGKIENTDKVSQAILAVFFDKADACLVTDRGFSTMNELNPQVGAKLVPLRQSPELVRGLICFRKDWDAETKQSTLDIMLNLHKEPKGAQILMIFQEEQLIPYDPRYLEQTRRLEEHFQTLKKSEQEKSQKARK